MQAPTQMDLEIYDNTLHFHVAKKNNKKNLMTVFLKSASFWAKKYEEEVKGREGGWSVCVYEWINRSENVIKITIQVRECLRVLI